jgi:hypothetical protein
MQTLLVIQDTLLAAMFFPTLLMLEIKTAIFTVFVTRHG